MESNIAGNNVDNRDRLKEKNRLESLISLYIDRIEGNEIQLQLTTEEEEDIKNSLSGMTPEQKVVEIYEYVFANAIRSDKSKEGLFPYDKTRLRSLWSDEIARTLFLDKYSESRLEVRENRLSSLSNSIRDLSDRIVKRKKSLMELDRGLNLHQNDMDSSEVKNKKARKRDLEKILVKLEQEKGAIISLDGYEHIPENTDVSAMVMYDTLQEYSRQNENDKFVWFPSREEIYKQIEKYHNAGKIPNLIGPAGTGKTTIFRHVAHDMTGEEYIHIACQPNMSEEGIIYKTDIQKGEGAHDYQGTVTEALTGYQSSKDQTSSFQYGRGVLFDEVSHLNSDKAKASIKKIQSLKLGDKLDGKPVLPGYIIGAASNEPVTEEALQREFARVPVDYLKMTAENPELYEFMLATLLRSGGHFPAIPEKLLKPAYEKVRVAEEQRPEFKDGSIGIERQELVLNHFDEKHGFLYRLAYAVRAIQDAYIHGSKFNEKHLANTALYEGINDQGKFEIKNYKPDLKSINQDQVISGEMVMVSASATLEARIIDSWMQGYNGDGDFVKYIQEQLISHIDQITEPDSRERVKAILDFFHIFDQEQNKDSEGENVLTPKTIGYLSPRVPRPWKIKKPEKKADKVSEDGVLQEKEIIRSTKEWQTEILTFEDDKRLSVASKSFVIENGIHDMVNIRDKFIINGKIYEMRGVLENKDEIENGKLVGKLIDSESYFRFSPEEIDEGMTLYFSQEFSKKLSEYEAIGKVICPLDLME